jgi:hypothetical protein
MDKPDVEKDADVARCEGAHDGLVRDHIRGGRREGTYHTYLYNMMYHKKVQITSFE